MPAAGAGAGAVSWLCTWWRQVAGAGAGCQCWCWVVLGAGAGDGAVSWLCTRGGDRLLVLVVVVVVRGAGAGAVSWLCTWWRQVAGAGCWVRVLGAGCWCWVLGTPALGAGAGRRELACRCLVLVPASDSEVIKSAGSDSEG